MGDFNVDLLPTCANDPWREYPAREKRHVEQRSVLRTVLESLRL